MSKSRRRKKAVQCVLCERQFIQTHSYVEHIINFHNKIEYPFIYNCEHCSRKFKFKHHVKWHMQMHDRSPRFPCKHCQEKFVTKKNRRSHIREVHIRSNIYQCCKCTSILPSKLSMHSHMESIHRINPKTHICNKCFALCEYRSVAFVKPVTYRIVNFEDTMYKHKELCKMIEARQCGDIIKQINENDEIIEYVPQKITKHDVRAVRKSVRKFFSILNHAKISKKRGEECTSGRPSSLKEDATSGIVIDSVVSLSNNVANIFNKNLVIKLERMDQTPYINKEYVEELPDIKSEPSDLEITSPYNLDVDNDYMVNGLNQYPWLRSENLKSQNLLVNMNYDQISLNSFKVSKTSVSREKTLSPTISNANVFNSTETEPDDFISIYQCRYCISKFTNKKSLANHVDKKHFSVLYIVYKCKKCDHIFNSKPPLIKHMTESHGSEKSSFKHKCMFCVKSFKSRTQLNQHIKSYHKNLIKCKKCNTQLNNFFSLKRHMKIKHNHSMREICKAIFPYESQLKQHNSDKKHSSVESETYNLHTEPHSSVVNLQSPVSLSKSSETNLNSSIPKVTSAMTVLGEDSLFPCNDSTVMRKSTIEEDMLFPHKAPVVHICQSCQRLHSSNENFLSKIQQKIIELPEILITSDSSEKKKSLKTCVVCNATLRVGTERHDGAINTHKPIYIKMFECVECHHMFAIPTKLINHMRLDHKTYLKSQQCVDYDINFQDAKTLETCRKRKHCKSIEDSIALNKSNSSMTSLLKKNYLQLRIVRANVSPRENKIIDLSSLLKCDHCSALFKLKSSLRSHMQLEHMPKVNLHKCCICNTVFYRITELDRHFKNKHQLDTELYSSNKELTNFNPKWKKI